MTAAGGWAGLGAATLTGTAAGAAGGFTGGFLNSVAFSGNDGFFSGDVGDAFFAGVDGMWKGALVGGASGALSYSARHVWNNTRGTWQADFAEGIDGEMPMKPSGSRVGQDFEKDLHSKFSKFAETNPHSGGESAGYYKVRRRLFSGEYYVKDLALEHFEGTSNTFNYSGYSRPDAFIHSHPNTSYPSFMGVRNDYTSSMKLLRSNITPYLLGADKNLYLISGSANTGYFHITF